MNWSVRQANIGDADRLALVGSATFLETFADLLDADAVIAHCRREHVPSAYEAHLRAGLHAWLVEADPGGAPIGFALLGSTSLPGSAAGDIELKRLYTLSRFHGQGLGAELMRRAVRHGEQHGFRRLLLGVYVGNLRARAFYAKQGFTQIADRRFRVGDHDYDDAVLARRLDTR